MAYKQKIDLVTDRTIQLGGNNSKGQPNPTSVEGYYLGHKLVESDYGPGKLHFFQTAEGLVGVWGKTNLNRIMTDDHRGQMCLVTFTGMAKPVKKGRRPAYTFSLQYDDENTIDVSGISINPTETADAAESTTETSSGGYDDESIEDSFEAEEEYEAPVAAPAPRSVVTNRPTATPNAAQQAKVQAILAKQRAKAV